MTSPISLSTKLCPFLNQSPIEKASIDLQVFPSSQVADTIIKVGSLTTITCKRVKSTAGAPVGSPWPTLPAMVPVMQQLRDADLSSSTFPKADITNSATVKTHPTLPSATEPIVNWSNTTTNLTEDSMKSGVKSYFTLDSSICTGTGTRDSLYIFNWIMSKQTIYLSAIKWISLWDDGGWRSVGDIGILGFSIKIIELWANWVDVGLDLVHCGDQCIFGLFHLKINWYATSKSF